MKKEVIVLSLGGSLIIPDNVDMTYLKKFKKTILKNTDKYRFIVTCGGGNIARKYINALKKAKADEKFQSFSGISATRMNARFMSYLFGFNPKKGIPTHMREIKKYLKSQDIVFCGALEYKPNQTSDSTAAMIAKNFKSKFINLTNVKGLFDKNPKTSKNAKFIPWISWQDFDEMAQSLKFKPGQHFVLDQTAAKMIKKHKIETFILGKNLKNLDKVLKGEDFTGTRIRG